MLSTVSTVSTEIVNTPASFTLNEQEMPHKEEARRQETRNDFSEQDSLSHAVRTPLHVLGGYVERLQKLSRGFSKLKMADPALRKNLFMRSTKLSRSLSTIKAQVELLTGGNYIEFFRLSPEKLDRLDEPSVDVFTKALGSMTSHINDLKTVQEKLKIVVRHFEKLQAEELKNKFDEIAKEMKDRIDQIKKDMDALNGTMSPALSASPSENKENNNATLVRILVVDDEPMNRKILGHMLKKQYHCELIFASNGEDAVKKWSENDLDIIFMDIQMPGINGLDATQMIRRQEGEKNKRRTPIIASTAIDSSTLDKGITAAAGMDGYIMKPYGKKQVHEIIRLHTSRSKKVCSGSESDVGVGDNDSDSDSRPLTPTPPIKTRKNLGNGFPPRLPASWSTPSDGGKLLEKFHFLGNKRNLAMGGLLASGVMPPPSPFTRSRL